MTSNQLAQVNPLVLLAIGLLAVVASSAVDDPRTGLVSVVVLAVLAVVFVPPLGWSLWRLLAPLTGAASVAFSTWLLTGQDASSAATAGLRVLVLAVPGVLLAPLVDPNRLGDQLAQRLRLPSRPVVATVASLTRFEQLGTVWSQLGMVRRVRGLGPGRNPVRRVGHVAAMTFGLLVATLRRSARMAVAMDARGFAAAQQRSWAEPAPWSRLDTAVLLIAVVLAAMPHLISGRG